MSEHYTCIAIDDDSLLLRKLDAFLEDISWIDLLETHTNPVQGATAVVTQQPDLVLLDIEMPHIDGHYLIDWIGPKLETLDKPPKVVIVSSLNVPEEDQVPGVLGYINKVDLTTPEVLEARLRDLIE